MILSETTDFNENL